MKKVVKSLVYRKFINGKNRSLNKKSQKKKTSQKGSGYTVSVEKGSIAGMPIYTGYDDQAPPAYVGGLTNTENSDPMVGGSNNDLSNKMKKDLKEIMDDIKNSLNTKSGGAHKVSLGNKKFRLGL